MNDSDEQIESNKSIYQRRLQWRYSRRTLRTGKMYEGGKRKGTWLVNNILNINDESRQLNRLRETEAYPIFGTNEEKKRREEKYTARGHQKKT